MCIRDRNRCRRLRNIRQSNKGLRGGDTPLPKHVEEKLWDVGAGKAVPLRDGVDDLGPEAGQSSVAVEDVMDELFRNVTRYNPEFERETISRAFQLASSMHGDQLRASGESFILHPLGTALICAELRLDSATITAALLHDVDEDTDAGLDLIEEEFGEEVALLVDRPPIARLHRQGLLWCPGHHPLTVETTAGSLQRLHSHAQVQHVPIASYHSCLLYTSPSPRDGLLSRMPS